MIFPVRLDILFDETSSLKKPQISKPSTDRELFEQAENNGDPWLQDVDGTPLYNGQSIVFYRCFLYVYGRITYVVSLFFRWQ